jgi:hypothetical protein
MATLTDRDKDLINLNVAPFKYPAARERQARDEFGLSGTQFRQKVNRILDMPEAHAWDPHTVARLKGRRIQRGGVAPVRRLL